MNKLVPISVLIVAAIIGTSAYAYTVYLPTSNSGQGTVNFYLTDPPPGNATLKYLLVNVTSVTLKYSSNLTETTTTTTTTGITTKTSTTNPTTQNSFENRFVFYVSSSVGTNVNLTKLQGPGLLLGATKVPAGNVTGIILNITGAEAFWTNGTHNQLKVVADGQLMINVQFTVQSGGTTNLTVAISPGSIHISPGNQTVLRPVVHVTAVSSGSGTTTTSEATTTENSTTT